MNYLIIAAHGSRKKESNQEVNALAKRMSEKLSHTFDGVEPAFLQFCEPSIEDQIDNLAALGAKTIIIFPFFIGSGSHITQDIPDIVKTAEKKYTQIQFKLTCHLGKSPGIEDVIADEVIYRFNDQS